MNPLSPKTIEKRFKEAGITLNERELLHRYMLCFSNLYGCIEIGVLWNVFKSYKENITMNKFYDYVDIAQRMDTDFYILNLNEVYTGETSEETENKLLVNKYLVRRFELKFWYIYQLEEYKDEKFGPYIPSKEELFRFDHDVFYDNEIGRKMVSLISNLKTSGISTNKINKKEIEMIDINGNKCKGKRLADIIYFDRYEQSSIDYFKRPNEKEYQIKKASIPSAKKILNEIKNCIMIYDTDVYMNRLNYILEKINYDLGVEFTEEFLNEFMALFMELSNNSNRWNIFGWKPNMLSTMVPKHDGPIKLSIGPNMRKMIEDGEYDLGEMDKFFKDNNQNVIIDDEEKDDYEKIIKKNNLYLEEFRDFLIKRNYRESIIDKHISRVVYYINHYLMHGIPKNMEDGCGLDVMSFIEDCVNRKHFPASVHNIDFYLVSISLFYECMCEKGRISKNVLKEFKKDITSFKDELVEDYYDCNPKEIDIYDVIEAIEMANGYGTAYMNIKTGEKVFIPEEESLYDGDLDELYDRIDTPNWVEIPEIKDYKIMMNFASQVKDKNISNTLIGILKNKHSYRNFKNAIFDMNIEDEYYDYYDEQIYQIAEDWLDENCVNELIDDYDEDIVFESDNNTKH